MKRRHPFNEIRAMGHIIEGMVINEPTVERVADCQHGPRWFYQSNLNEWRKTNPVIKNDQELIDILSMADEHPWDIHRLSRLRSGLSHLSEDIRLVERRKKAKAKRIQDEEKRKRVRKEIDRQCKEERERQKLYKIEGPKQSWLDNPQTFPLENTIKPQNSLVNVHGDELAEALKKEFTDLNGNPYPWPPSGFKYTIFGQ